MDTVMSIAAYGENAESAASEVERRIYELDALWSIGNPSSDISLLNSGRRDAELNPETDKILREAERVRDMTDGAFDERIFAAAEAWGFYSGEYRVPTQDELRRLISLRDKIDLGAIAKGYASDEAAELLRDAGISSAIINLGGNVYAIGGKPGGGDWTVGVRDPFNLSKNIVTLKLRDRAAVTSGGYERYFEQDGARYHHILDPRTGYPADAGLASVTVVSESGTLADGLSTGLFVLGKERALELWRENRALFDLVLIENDGTVTITEGIKKAGSSGRLTTVAAESIIGIYKNGERIHTAELDAVSEPYDVKAGEGNIVRVAPGEVYMLSADCRDQICVHHAALRRGNGESNRPFDAETPIVCLPNNVVVKWELAP
jgi:thiamine biosynthesis lipoprotein